MPAPCAIKISRHDLTMLARCFMENYFFLFKNYLFFILLHKVEK